MLTHEQVQAAISARLDGEARELDDDVVDAHVANCPQCRAFQDKAAALSRSLSLVESAGDGMAPPRDLADSILAGVEPQWRRASSARQMSVQLARLAVAALAICFAVWAAVLIVHSSGLAPLRENGTVLDPLADPDRAALSMEAAAVRLGIASGLGFVAWRPRLAPGLLPFACTTFLFLLGFAMRDIAWGTLAAQQVYFLAAVGASAAALAWCWAADRGYVLRAALRGLSADPN